jgi:phosphomannomutase
VLTLAASTDTPLSELIKPIARYAQSGEINFEVEDKDGAIAELKATYEGRGEIDELDGVTVDCFAGEGWWCNVRKSNTEPLLRLNLEAKDGAKLQEMVEELSSMLGTVAAH